MPQTEKNHKKLTHDQNRRNICVLCLLKKNVRSISQLTGDLIKSHIPGLDFENDSRLPNGICDSCRKALQDSKRRHLLPEPKDYTQFTVQSSSAHNEDTCRVCILGRMSAVDEKKLASQIAAHKKVEKLSLCPKCLAYRAEGNSHDCQLSQLPREKPTTSTSQSQTSNPTAEDKKGSYFEKHALLNDYVLL